MRIPCNRAIFHARVPARAGSEEPMGKTLYDKVFDMHKVSEESQGRYRMAVDLHLLHEATSAPAFGLLAERGIAVNDPSRTISTVDHVIPTDGTELDSQDQGRALETALARNSADAGIRHFSRESKENGVVHVIAPEMGLTRPGMTIACGDSHTSTHGAFGALAFGIGTSQVAEILASQSIVVNRLGVKNIEVNGPLAPHVTAKDIVLHVIGETGVRGGIGHAYEFSGSTIHALDMEGRMTICNMAVEGGARCGYVNPDEVTYDYLSRTRYAPRGADWTQAVHFWKSIRTDQDAAFAAGHVFSADEMAPMVTWGVTPGQVVRIDGQIPDALEDSAAADACAYMNLQPGQNVIGIPVDVAFIGSCTNGRVSDFVSAARVLEGRRVRPGVRALAVPGSWMVYRELVARGIDEIFRSAGFEFREPGCSMCLAMNPDKLIGRELCASSSNRNFKGRQGSATGRTMLMSPAMVAAAAVEGHIVDVRGF